MRAALYARYSTDEQNVASTEDQLRGCRILCERNGFEIVDEYSDPAMSGHESNRPQYRKMIAAAKARGFDVVVAHELSRLSRNEAETHTLREELEWLRVHIVTAIDGINIRIAGMGILFSVRAAMAKTEGLFRTGALQIIPALCQNSCRLDLYVSRARTDPFRDHRSASLRCPTMAACRARGISARTIEHWHKQPGGEDGRCGSHRRPPSALPTPKWVPPCRSLS